MHDHGHAARSVTCVRHRRKVALDGGRITHQGTPDLCDSERFRVTEEVERGYVTGLSHTAAAQRRHASPPGKERK